MFQRQTSRSPASGFSKLFYQQSCSYTLDNSSRQMMHDQFHQILACVVLRSHDGDKLTAFVPSASIAEVSLTLTSCLPKPSPLDVLRLSIDVFSQPCMANVANWPFAPGQFQSAYKSAHTLPTRKKPGLDKLNFRPISGLPVVLS
jgi:hypothetical protein